MDNVCLLDLDIRLSKVTGKRIIENYGPGIEEDEEEEKEEEEEKKEEKKKKKQQQQQNFRNKTKIIPSC